MLVELPRLRDAERSGTQRCYYCLHVAAIWSQGQSCARCSDECPVQFDVGADQRGRVDCVDAGSEKHPNPGPPSTRIRPEGVSEAVVESLEQALIAVDTDEEPLVRAMTGRHVIRRVGEQRSVFFHEIGVFR